MGDPGPDPSVSIQDVLRVFKERAEICEPLEAREVGDELEIAKRTAHKHLQRAEDNTRLRSKRVGANAKVWWLPPGDDCK